MFAPGRLQKGVREPPVYSRRVTEQTAGLKEALGALGDLWEGKYAVLSASYGTLTKWTRKCTIQFKFVILDGFV